MTRFALVTAFSATLLRAQETGSVGWDPREVGWPTTSGQFVLAGLATCAYWWAARWFIDHRRGRPRWKNLRYWWPTLMVAVGGLPVLLENVLRNNFGDWAVGVFCGAAVLLNLPAALVALVVGPIIVMLNLTDWTAGAVTAPFLWATWYGIIRFLESRSSPVAPVSVIPADAPAPSSPPARK